MHIACDEADHTGPDLLAREQPYFAFASININDEEAADLIAEARRLHPVQMPELKAAKLLSSRRGRQLISTLVRQGEGRFAITASDKKLALCGWVFEYVFEPVFKDDPRIFYKKDFHRFVAMFCYIYVTGMDEQAEQFLVQFQAYMRTKDRTVAPMLFEYRPEPGVESLKPFDLLRIFATGYREVIAADNADLVARMADHGRWTLDLSASSLWSHLNHWGKQGIPLSVFCDDSKPLRAIADELGAPDQEHIIRRIKEIVGVDEQGWELAGPITFVNSRSYPSVQLADILASTAAYAFQKGLPTDMEPLGPILDAGMLRDSIFPDSERLNLRSKSAVVNYAALHELAMTARGDGTGLPLEVYFRIAEDAFDAGTLRMNAD
ncbi:DUF3800 domain-containing protein [Neorhizobium tomejilense]|uniref:DUF3800 domain-containing protein n=1 Tax=Neorhizobium tomejilense TaxID=2093828 RepID=UPI000CF90291|nr:DUF3800 domain-containing protein [Neorhizobium tomejilense]